MGLKARSAAQTHVTAALDRRESGPAACAPGGVPSAPLLENRLLRGHGDRPPFVPSLVHGQAAYSKKAKLYIENKARSAAGGRQRTPGRMLTKAVTSWPSEMRPRSLLRPAGTADPHEAAGFGGAELAIHTVVLPLDGEGTRVTDVVQARMMASKSTSPRPTERKSQPRRGSPKGRWDERIPVRPSRLTFTSFMWTW